ncbi:MAG: uncharacterized membrane protein (UPF0127 family) [Burkholderiaceae bacterium]|jgi:uncharacterized membrane protein (UPF0127 family)
MAERFFTAAQLFRRMLNITMTSPSFSLRTLVFSGALLLSSYAGAQQPVKFNITTLSVGIHLIKAEVAASPAEREQGLMFREKMGANEGMVFSFGAPAGVCMWMKNTLLPLSVAFIDDDGKIINIEDMKPQTTESHCALKQVSYALEMNAGWFKQKNIKAGMTVDGLSKIK